MLVFSHEHIYLNQLTVMKSSVLYHVHYFPIQVNESGTSQHTGAYKRLQTPSPPSDVKKQSSSSPDYRALTPQLTFSKL